MQDDQQVIKKVERGEVGRRHAKDFSANAFANTLLWDNHMAILSVLYSVFGSAFPVSITRIWQVGGMSSCADIFVLFTHHLINLSHLDPFLWVLDGLI